jgi:hypothetical protein
MHKSSLLISFIILTILLVCVKELKVALFFGLPSFIVVLVIFLFNKQKKLSQHRDSL